MTNYTTIKIKLFSKRTNLISGILFSAIFCLLFFLKSNNKLDIDYFTLIFLFMIFLTVRVIMFIEVKISLDNNFLYIKYLYHKFKINLTEIEFVFITPISASKGLGIGIRYNNKIWNIVPEVTIGGLKLKDNKNTIAIYFNNESGLNLLMEELRKRNVIIT